MARSNKGYGQRAWALSAAERARRQARQDFMVWCERQRSRIKARLGRKYATRRLICEADRDIDRADNDGITRHTIAHECTVELRGRA